MKKKHARVREKLYKIKTRRNGDTESKGLEKGPRI